MKRPARFIMMSMLLVAVVTVVTFLTRPRFVSPLVEGSGVSIILLTPTPAK